MLKRIEMPNGKRWAIVFDCEHYSLENVCEMQKGLINVLITATQADGYDSAKYGFYETLNLLNESLLSIDQYLEYERFLKSRK
jgi:transposase